MPKATVWILFNSKCKRQKETGMGWGEKKKEREKRQNKQKDITPHGSRQQNFLHPGLLSGGAPGVILVEVAVLYSLNPGYPQGGYRHSHNLK